MLEVDEDDDGGFGNSNQMYKMDVNDPSLSNAGQTHCFFELMHTYNLYTSNNQSHNFKLAKTIINSENLPNEFLGLTPL